MHVLTHLTTFVKHLLYRKKRDTRTTDNRHTTHHHTSPVSPFVPAEGVRVREKRKKQWLTQQLSPALRTTHMTLQFTERFVSCFIHQFSRIWLAYFSHIESDTSCVSPTGSVGKESCELRHVSYQAMSSVWNLVLSKGTPELIASSSSLT